MPNLLAMSFEGELAPSFDLLCLAPGRALPDGWGLGYYPGGEPSAVVLKEPAPPQGSIRSQLARAWEHLESGLFVLHIRSARWGANTDANTQPFVRSWGRRDWMMGHSGSLTRRPPDDRGLFEPVGSTDTEQLFCTLLGRFAERGWKSLGEADLATVRDWLDVFDDDGGLTIALTDGKDLVVYADRDQEGTLYLGNLMPPYERVALGDADLVVDLGARGTKSVKGVIVSSVPLDPVVPDGVAAPATPEEAPQVRWRPIPPGTLLAIRQGAVVASHGPKAAGPQAQADLLAPSVLRRAAQSGQAPAPVRTFDVRHRTVYRYTTPVERSTHLIRMTPRHDRLQELLEHRLDISVAGQAVEFEDVFDNRVRRLLIETPWTEMVLEATSRVRVADVAPLDLRAARARSTIPLVWMPWQRQIMAPYLLPPELPESQLHELTAYAMSFVKRNDFDLFDTLLDVNATIYSEYAYRQGSTTVFTTPFEVYTNRRGVCQDFTNLFICLARLLGVPARYVCGYVHCGPGPGPAAGATDQANAVQSEASHAWVQLYLPELGWKGFDPTNGILTQTEHVRVAVGRNYLDATPTSGTIYVGGGPETLEVDVRVDLVDGP
ncbi:MAG TPA: class II glutamine amidotransferase [Kofleriaceae bacterium]|nr:class II glutamine amidotransferase [Kofleriaceae bacterium]